MNEAPFQLIGHFKTADGVKNWDSVTVADQRNWFEKYYLSVARELGDSVPSVD